MQLDIWSIFQRAGAILILATVPCAITGCGPRRNADQSAESARTSPGRLAYERRQDLIKEENDLTSRLAAASESEKEPLSARLAEVSAELDQLEAEEKERHARELDEQVRASLSQDDSKTPSGASTHVGSGTSTPPKASKPSSGSTPTCRKHCSSRSQPCGDSCISLDKMCRQPKGSAC